MTSGDEYRYCHSKVTYIDYLIQQGVDHRSIKIPNRQLLVDDHCMIKLWNPSLLWSTSINKPTTHPQKIIFLSRWSNKRKHTMTIQSNPNDQSNTLPIRNLENCDILNP